MLSLAVLGPIYSVVYTDVAINPGGFLDKITAPDSDIPNGVAGAKWYKVPGIWWNIVERLSWTMVGKQARVGCKFRAVASNPFNNVIAKASGETHPAVAGLLVFVT